MTRRRRHHSSAMKVRGRGRAYKRRAWVRLFDGAWNCTASSRTIRRGGGRLPTPEELLNPGSRFRASVRIDNSNGWSGIVVGSDAS